MARAIQQLTIDDKFRLLSMTTEGDNGCIDFVTTPDEDGYCKVSIRGMTHIAHRVFYELHHGPIPEGYDCHHECRNRRCVNINHLTIKTKACHTAHHNIERRNAGELPGQKLTAELVEKLKLDCHNGMSYLDASTKYGVRPMTISKLMLGQRWADTRPELNVRKKNTHGSGTVTPTSNNTYRARLIHNTRRYHLGTHKTREQAQQAIDNKRAELISAGNHITPVEHPE